MRKSTNQTHPETGKLINGYDYQLQCWVINGIIQRCGHPESMHCDCYGRIHAGEHTN